MIDTVWQSLAAGVAAIALVVAVGVLVRALLRTVPVRAWLRLSAYRDAAEKRWEAESVAFFQGLNEAARRDRRVAERKARKAARRAARKDAAA